MTPVTSLHLNSLSKVVVQGHWEDSRWVWSSLRERARESKSERESERERGEERERRERGDMEERGDRKSEGEREREGEGEREERWRERGAERERERERERESHSDPGSCVPSLDAPAPRLRRLKPIQQDVPAP